MPQQSEEDKKRGIQYAECLDVGTLCYPDPERMARINKEWEDADLHVQV